MAANVLKQRVLELDGLRGCAILSVLIFHYISQEGVLPHRSVADRLQRLVIMGWTGVDLFFVLSGFLIGGILIAARNSPSYFKTFYVRRFFRIVPIYYVWTLLYIALIAFAGAKIARLSNSGIQPPLNFGIFSYLLFLQNILPTTLFGLAGAWFGHFWSLAVEEQFYIVAPSVVRFTTPRALQWTLSVVIVAVPLMRIFLLRVAHFSPSQVTVSTYCRADALALGMLAALWTGGPTPKLSVSRIVPHLYGLLGFLAIGVVALWLYAPQSSTFGMQSIGYTWMAFFYVVILLLAVGHSEGWIARIFRNRWLREIGVVAYCMYIIHIVVNVVLHAVVLHRAPHISNPRGALVTILAAGVTFGLAKLSWALFEGPLQRMGHVYKY